MKKYISLCALTMIILLAACARQSETLPRQSETLLMPSEALPLQSETLSSQANTSIPQAEVSNNIEKSDMEKQLEFLSANFEQWKAEDESDWWGYAVTDLDQNGRLEIITAENHGTGHYTTTSIREVSSDVQSLFLCGSDTSCDVDILQRLAAEGGPQSCGPLIMPHQCSEDMPQAYPVYYDAGANQYHYIFGDCISEKDEWYGTFENQRSFSLQDDEITGTLLIYKKSVHGGTEEYWNMDGEYINAETYETAINQYYSDLEKMEAELLWISTRHLGEEDVNDVYAMLEKSMDSFVIKAKL